jgi:hypothetical protein
MKSGWLLVLLLLGSGTCAGQMIPEVKGKALDDSEVVLPKPGSKPALILIVGFSRKGGDACAVWNKKIAAAYHEDARVGYYNLPMLEEAPSLIRPIIVHGMKKGAAPGELGHFVPQYAKENEWKKLVNYAAADDAYLLVADAGGKVAWQGHGIYSDGVFAEMKKAVEGLAGTGNWKK